MCRQQRAITFWAEAGTEDEGFTAFGYLAVFANDSSVLTVFFILAFNFSIPAFVTPGAPLCPAAAAFDGAASVTALDAATMIAFAAVTFCAAAGFAAASGFGAVAIFGAEVGLSTVVVFTPQ
jgi:hypothetical protein